MKVAEFREKVKHADRANLEAAAAELYKQIPKKAKDEELDQIIEEILTNGKKPEKKSCPAKSFDELKKDIDQFLDYAKEELYLKEAQE